MITGYSFIAMPQPPAVTLPSWAFPDDPHPDPIGALQTAVMSRKVSDGMSLSGAIARLRSEGKSEDFIAGYLSRALPKTSG